MPFDAPVTTATLPASFLVVGEFIVFVVWLVVWKQLAGYMAVAREGDTSQRKLRGGNPWAKSEIRIRQSKIVDF